MKAKIKSLLRGLFIMPKRQTNSKMNSFGVFFFTSFLQLRTL
nr:MAG TPA: hypothetical protein [Caudoviricetes sp.]